MNERRDDLEPRHPIRVVSTRTGLSPSALRAWERRYEAVSPGRSEGGQRLYSDADLRRLTLLRRATDSGRSIGQVVDLDDEELRGMLEADARAQAARGSARAVGSDETLDGVVETCLSAVRALDAPTLEAELGWVLTAHGAEPFTDAVVAPLLAKIGDLWREGRITPAHEHLASDVIHRVAGRLLSVADRPHQTRGRVVIATLPGESHDLGALLAAVTAKVSGWQVVFLGADLPGMEIADAANAVDADLVGLSLINPNGNAALAEVELAKLLDTVDPSTRVLLGGGGADRIGLGMEDRRLARVRSLADFRKVLNQVGSPSA